MSAGAGVVLVLALAASGCQSLGRFDTKGSAAYCGSIVASKFVLTPGMLGGFDRALKLTLKLDTSALTTFPGSITSNDEKDGPCPNARTFDDAKLVVTPEVVNDPLSTLTFDEGQVQNIVAWVDSTCRGKMLAIVSLYKTNHVEVRLLKPGAETLDSSNHDAFALFRLDRNDSGCEN